MRLTLNVIFILVSVCLLGACDKAKPQATPAEVQYADWFEDMNERLLRSEEEFLKAIDDLIANSNDSYAQLVLAREIVNFGSYSDEATEQTVPDSLKDVHDTLILSIDHYDKIGQILMGEDSGEVQTEMLIASAAAREAGTKYRKWRESRAF